jgi:hypothetical protein
MLEAGVRDADAKSLCLISHRWDSWVARGTGSRPAAEALNARGMVEVLERRASTPIVTMSEGWSVDKRTLQGDSDLSFIPSSNGRTSTARWRSIRDDEAQQRAGRKVCDSWLAPGRTAAPTEL